MESDGDIGAFEPTIPGAVWRYRVLVAAAILAGALAGAAYALTQPSAWSATASLVVEDPRASAVFELGAAQSPERYVENQVEIIRSPVVAARAAELLSAAGEGTDASEDEVDDAVTVASRSDRDLVEISYRSDVSPDLAVAGADAVALAYQDVRRREASSNFAAALGRLDESIAASEADLAVIQERIAAQRGADESRDRLDAQFAAAVNELVEIQEALAAGPGDELLLARLAAVQDQFRTIQIILDIEVREPELAALVEEQREAIARLSNLIARRDQLAVDAEIAGSGVVLYSPASKAVSTGVALSRAVPVGAVLGALAGAAGAYALALSRRRFEGRAEPEVVLGAPLVAEIPDFGEERLRRALPVVDAPASVSAEAFRFAATALDVARPGAEGRRSALRTVVIASADPEDGKSVVAANIGLAAAREGKRVLLIDADFGNQGLVRVLSPSLAATPGLSDLVLDDVPTGEAVNSVTFADGTSVSLLTRGNSVTTASEFFHSPLVGRFVQALQADYDLVLIDSPPLLHVAYTASLVAMGDGVLVVVRHGSRVSALEDVRDRLRLFGAPIAGYVYNASPLRREMVRGVGSTRDVLGGSGAKAKSGAARRT